MERVLLINPPRNLRNPKNSFSAIPTGIANLAGFLQINGFMTDIFDMIGEDPLRAEKKPNNVYRVGASNQALIDKLNKYKPTVVGISCSFTPRFSNVIEVADTVNAWNKDVKVVVGGMHATVAAEEVLKTPSIDFVIMGEAEIPLANLLMKLHCKQTDFDTIQALSTKTKITNERVLIDDLNAMPLPAYELLPMENYFKYMKRDSLSTEKRQVSVITSRGCPMACTFCSSFQLWHNKWRPRSSAHILAELELLIRLYDIKEVSFEDDNISLDPARLDDLCREMIHRNLRLKWNTPNGIAISQLNPDLLVTMKKSGCTRLNFGIESGDEKILNEVMKKNLNLDKVRLVVQQAHDIGLVTLGYFVLGMPGETDDSVKRTIEFAKSLKLDEIGVFIATPFPKTGLEKMCIDGGFLKKSYLEIEAEDDIENHIFYETPDMPAEKLNKHREMFFKEFYKQKIFEQPFYYVSRLIRNPKLLRRLWQK